jgi:hypothetical protein
MPPIELKDNNGDPNYFRLDCNLQSAVYSGIEV